MQNLILVYPVYPSLFSKAGLSLSQISLLLAIWSVPVVLLEIPSGVLADRWNRRYLLIISGVLRTLCFTIWLVLPPLFFVFALGFLAWGTAEALSSGAEEALLFDSLKLEGRQEAFETISGRGSGSASVAVALSCFTGGFVAPRFGFPVVLLFSVVVSLVVMRSISIKRDGSNTPHHTCLKMRLATFARNAVLCIWYFSSLFLSPCLVSWMNMIP
jgi:MFS family permease